MVGYVKPCLVLQSVNFYACIPQKSIFKNPNLYPNHSPSSSSTSLITPPPIHNPTPIHLPLPQHNLPPPLRPINRIHKPTRLYTEPTPGTPSLYALHLRDINILPRIKLERRLRSQDLEMDLRFRMIRGDDRMQRFRARVNWDLRGFRRVDDKAVVDIRLHGP